VNIFGASPGATVNRPAYAFYDDHPTENFGWKIFGGRFHIECKRLLMPELETIERAQEDAREGKSPSTQAGEFVREEIHHIREGKHGASSHQQAIAIGLSKARRAGVKLPPPKGPASLRRKAAQDSAEAENSHKPSPKRSRVVSRALQREPKSAASRQALPRQAKKSAAKRGSRARSQAASKAARTRKVA
jgi:hypothetical protein